MEKQERCPYCGGELRPGYIPTGRILTWKPDYDRDEEYRPIRLCRLPMWEEEEIECRVCYTCRKLIMSLPDERETEGVLTKLDRFEEKITQKLEQWQQERDAEAEEKSRKIKGKKDPWED